MTRSAVLAIDGGGSKLDAALLGADGTLLGAARIEATGDEGSGSDSHMRQIEDAARTAAFDAGLDPNHLPLAPLGVYCLAGADMPSDDRRITRWLSRRRLTTTDLVRNDCFAVLRAGTDRTWGVGVVCGSGMNCAGVAPDGRITRFPAIGAISGDWGGGMQLGETALWYAVRGEDGRGERTTLERLVPDHFGLRRPRQVTEALYRDRIRMDRLRELTPIVFDAAKEGDRMARRIVEQQADEVVAMAGTAIRRLRMTRLDVDVVLGGGVFRADDPAFFDRMREGIHRVAPAARVTVLAAPPVVGAALMGLDSGRRARAAQARVRSALTPARRTNHTQQEER
jgi:N-acetylglucosamine kinase-like BadF-type ATPase